MTAAGSAAIFRLLVLACLLLPPAALAQAPEPGLMWNRTGLPAVFPLQIKTRDGANYLLTLRDAGTQEPALAAYFEGGDTFRILVPPGRFTLHFAWGQIWQGPEQAFGPGALTQRLDLAEPLSFAVTGFSTKSGHSVDLRGLDLDADPATMAGATVVEPLDVCQTLTRDAGAAPPDAGPPPRTDRPGELARPNVLRAQPRRTPDLAAPSHERLFRNPDDLPDYLKPGGGRDAEDTARPPIRPDRFAVRDQPC